MATFNRRTWNASDVTTRAKILGDSVSGGWTFSDRFVSYFFAMIRYYKDRGFNISGEDLTLNGGTPYNSAPSGFVKGPYVSGARPGTSGSNNSTAAIAGGCTDLFWTMTTNAVQLGYMEINPEDPNPGIWNEQADIIEAVQAECDTAGVRLHVFLQNTRFPHAAYEVEKDQSRTISDFIRTLPGINVFDIFDVMANPADSDFGFLADFKDKVHWTEEGDTKCLEALIQYVNTFNLLIDPMIPPGDAGAIGELGGFAIDSLGEYAQEAP